MNIENRTSCFICKTNLLFTKHSRSKFANILADLPLFGGKYLCHFQEAISSRVRPQFLSYGANKSVKFIPSYKK